MKFTVHDTIYDLDQNKLTFGEAAAIEEATNLTIAEVADLAARGSFRAVGAYIWTAMKRQDPAVTFATVQALDISDVQFEVDKPDETTFDGDPTGGEPASPSAA